MKIISITKRILSCMLFVSIIFSISSIPVSANQYNENNGFYLKTDSVPLEVVNYAVDNVFDYIASRIEIDALDLSSITMGSPFTMSSASNTIDTVYYFPIYSGNQIIYTFRVYLDEDMKYTGILSAYLAQQLNKYSDLTSSTLPLQIYLDNGNVMAMQNGSVEVFEKDHLNREPSNIMKTFFSNSGTIADISEPINFVTKPILRTPASHNLTLDMKETQGSKPWCAAYASACILRYQGAGDSVTAEAMMKATFPSLSSSELDKKSISDSLIVTYAKNKGYSKTTSTSGTLSNTTVVSEIYTNDTPIYMNCGGTGDAVKSRHALVLSGFNNTNSTYTVWNPWYSYTETMSQSTKTYKVNDSSGYKWENTILSLGNSQKAA